MQPNHTHTQKIEVKTLKILILAPSLWFCTSGSCYRLSFPICKMGLIASTSRSLRVLSRQWEHMLLTCEGWWSGVRRQAVCAGRCLTAAKNVMLNGSYRDWAYMHNRGLHSISCALSVHILAYDTTFNKTTRDQYLFLFFFLFFSFFSCFCFVYLLVFTTGSCSEPKKRERILSALVVLNSQKEKECLKLLTK